MIEKIGTNAQFGEWIPCKEVIDEIKRIKGTERKNISVAEIGVGIGTTSVAILELLEEGDKLYIFDFEEVVAELKEDLEKINSKKVEIVAKGSSHKTYDSYNWNLAKMIMEMRECGTKGLFDIVYLDGAHTFMTDATCTNLLKEACKDSGIIVFDDYYWTHMKSPTCNPSISAAVGKGYTLEQMETPGIEMVCKIFMDSDAEFVRIWSENSERALYQKVTQAEKNRLIWDLQKRVEAEKEKRNKELWIVNKRYQLVQRMLEVDFTTIDLPQKLVIYGAGKIGKLFCDKIKDRVSVELFLDEYSKETSYKGISIVRPKEIEHCENILVTATYDMENIVVKLQSKADKIISLDDVLKING